MVARGDAADDEAAAVQVEQRLAGLHGRPVHAHPDRAAVAGRDVVVLRGDVGHPADQPAGRAHRGALLLGPGQQARLVGHEADPRQQGVRREDQADLAAQRAPGLRELGGGGHEIGCSLLVYRKQLQSVP